MARLFVLLACGVALQAFAEDSDPQCREIHNDQVTAIGSLPLSQGDLGLPRFKAALGTLRVKDELLVRYSIVAVQPITE